MMEDYLRIPPEKIHVVPLGINLNGYPSAPAASDPARPFTIGYFARVTPEKGLHLLAEAYCVLRQERGLPAARLEAAGYLGAEYRDYLRDIERKLRHWGLAGEFRYHGTLDREEKMRFMQGLDVLSVPSPYPEPKGIYLLEAMACGVPFVQPRHGAFLEIVAKTGGGVMFEPGDASNLADALQLLWQDPARRIALGGSGFEGVRRHFPVRRMAEETLAVFERVAAARARQPAAAR
jgi:glycosyltransferase involved in cell wall biosynthesis